MIGHIILIINATKFGKLQWGHATSLGMRYGADSSSGNGLVSHTRWGSGRQGAYMHRFITGVTSANTAMIASMSSGPGVAWTSCSDIGQNSWKPPHALARNRCAVRRHAVRSQVLC